MGIDMYPLEPTRREHPQLCIPPGTHVYMHARMHAGGRRAAARRDRHGSEGTSVCIAMRMSAHRSPHRLHGMDCRARYIFVHDPSAVGVQCTHARLHLGSHLSGICDEVLDAPQTATSTRRATTGRLLGGGECRNHNMAMHAGRSQTTPKQAHRRE